MERSTTYIIARKLRILRQDRKISQGEVAEILGISQPAYNKIESGSTSLSVDYLLKLTSYYRLDIRFFVDPETH